MSDVEAQYEAYPYPERDPADEAKRLIVGSPSHPVELDHYLFAGRRDWTKPFRALVAGGGTGDALIQLAQVLASAGRAGEDHLSRPFHRRAPDRRGAGGGARAQRHRIPYRIASGCGRFR
jgi:hypothetical protein